MPAWPLTLYFDGACPLCAREIKHLRRHADPARLLLVDISAVDFIPPLDLPSDANLHQRLHARLADGQWLSGPEATLWSWRAAGLGHWVAPLAWPWLHGAWQALYGLFSMARPYLGWLPHPGGQIACHTDQQSKKNCTKH